VDVADGVQATRRTPVNSSREPSLLSETQLPRGDFVSAQHESDCARFVAEAKNLARRRVEARLARSSVAA